MNPNVQSLQLTDQKVEQIQNQTAKSLAPGSANTFDAVRDTLNLIIETGSSNGLTNLVQMRMLLEPGIAALVAETATQENIDALQQAVAAMDAVLDDAETFIEADHAFHLALANATQNSLVIKLLDLFISLLRDQSAQTFLVNRDARQEQAYHKRILAAVIQRNPGAARQAMTDHLKQILEDSTAVENLEMRN